MQLFLKAEEMVDVQNVTEAARIILGVPGLQMPFQGNMQNAISAKEAGNVKPAAAQVTAENRNHRVGGNHQSNLGKKRL